MHLEVGIRAEFVCAGQGSPRLPQREPILGRDAKLATLPALCAAHGLAPADALAVGDGANDLKMMALAGLSVAYRAKPVVREKATQALNHSPLDGVLNWFAA